MTKFQPAEQQQAQQSYAWLAIRPAIVSVLRQARRKQNDTCSPSKLRRRLRFECLVFHIELAWGLWRVIERAATALLLWTLPVLKSLIQNGVILP